MSVHLVPAKADLALRVMKQYKAPLVGGPWTLVSQSERGFRFDLLCENDILKLATLR
jgi:hypothetical protein